MMEGLTNDLIPMDRSLSEESLLTLAEATRARNPIILATFCAAFAEKTNRVLLIQLGDYARGQIGGNPWTLPGGSVEVGENCKQAACREIAEEARVRVEPDQLQLAAWISRPYVSRQDRRGEITLIFTAHAEQQTAIASPPETLAATWSAFDLAEWLAVPDSGQGSHLLQPLRRHWIYWTWFAWQRIRQSTAIEFAIYRSSEQLRERPKQIA